MLTAKSRRVHRILWLAHRGQKGRWFGLKGSCHRVARRSGFRRAGPTNFRSYGARGIVVARVTWAVPFGLATARPRTTVPGCRRGVSAAGFELVPFRLGSAPPSRFADVVLITWRCFMRLELEVPSTSLYSSAAVCRSMSRHHNNNNITTIELY